MALYEYSAFDALGKKRHGVVEALSQKAAGRKLRDEGLFPTKLTTTGNPVGTAQRTFFRRVSAAQLGVATRQLATMLAAGMPLDEALMMVAEQQTQGSLGSVLTRVRDDVLQGSALHSALQAHPKIFPPLYTSMVQVGEASGTLDKVLLQLAEFTDDQARFNSQFKAALTYPILMFLVGSGVLLFLM
ncbi:MAG: type II secretion system protein GspF, partial [Deltaproteobacteria bacterium]